MRLWVDFEGIARPSNAVPRDMYPAPHSMRWPHPRTLWMAVPQVPADLPLGEYALGFRWDCETSAQVWQSCADITIEQIFTTPKRRKETIMNYPLAFSTWGKEEVEAIKRVIDTDMYTMGRHVKQFEQEFAETFGSPHAVMVNSGSSANLLMLSLLKLFFKLVLHLL